MRSRDCCDNCTAHLLRGGQEGGSTDAATGEFRKTEYHRMKWFLRLAMLQHFVADPDPVSGAFLTPGSGIRNRFFPDPGSQTHIFESLVTYFGKKYNTSLKIGPNFFLQHFKTKIIFNFVKFVATIKRYDN